jgi:type IV pilus assembly protein PilM
MLGLDISSASIKLVELGKNEAGDLVLERCALEVLPPGWITDGNIDKFDEVADALRRLLKKSGTQARNVAMALPASSVFTKKIVLPGGLSDQELEVQVEAEANQYIPYPLDEASLDFCVMGPSAAAPDDVDVLIAASRREKVQDIQGLAEAAGLRPVIVEVASNATRLALGRLLHHLPQQGKGAVVALFDIGALTTSMQILCDDQVLYERDQAFGGAQLTQLIVQQYGFTHEEAESRKRSGELPDDYEVSVLQGFVESLVQELSRALQFFFANTAHHKVDHILLAGGAATAAGLADAVTQQLGSPCTLADPFDGMVIGDGVRQKKMLREAPAYLTACGLALRRFLP